MRYNNNYMNNMYSSTSTFGRKIPNEYHKLQSYLKDNNYLEEEEIEEPDSKRSVLNKLLAPLNVGQYAVAGFAKGFVSDEINPIEGVLKGIWSANPLSEKQEWQYSFSEVLDDAGWKPETLGGKIVKGVVGTGLDIFLDPSTYITGGAMGIVKGTGAGAAKTATGAANIVDLLGDSAKFVDNIEDLTKAGRMTQDVAEAVVKNSKLFKSGMDTIDVAEDATRLMNKFNDLIGVYDKSSAVTLSLANAPFGKKIFGKHADKSLTLISSDVMKGIGDSTLAPMYGALRNQIYGGKIGELFAPNHTLYKLGKSDPGFVYDFMKSVDLQNGLSVDKKTMADIIRKEGEKLLNLTPKQQEEVISAMENKTIAHKVKKMMRFSETEDAMAYTEKIRQAKKATEDKIDDLIRQYEDLGVDIDTKSSNAKANRQTAEHIKQKRVEDLHNLDARYVNMTDKADEVNDLINKTADTINPKRDNKSVVDKWNKQKEHFKQAQAETEILQSYHDTRRHTDGIDIGLGQKPGDVLLDEAARTKIEKIEMPEGVSKTSWGRHKKQLREKGYIEYTKRRADSNAMLEKLGEGWVQSEFPGGKTRLYPPGFDDIIIKPNIVMETATPKTTRIDAIDSISEYVYGKKGFISYDTYENKLDEVVKMIEGGADPEAIHYKMLQTRGFYNGAATAKYSYVAGQVGYGKDKGNWDVFYSKRMEDLNKKREAYNAWQWEVEDLKRKIAEEVPVDEQSFIFKDLTKEPNTSTAREKLRQLTLKKNTPPEFSKIDADMVTTLHQKKLHREVVLYQFKDAHTAQETVNVIQNIQDAQLEEFATEHFDDYITALRRNEFNIEDFMDKHTSGAKRQYHKSDKKGEIFKLSPKEKEELFNHLNSEDVLRNHNTGKYKKSPKQLADMEESKAKFESAKKLRDELSEVNTTRHKQSKEIEEITKEIKIAADKGDTDLVKKGNAKLKQLKEEQLISINQTSELKTKIAFEIDRGQKLETGVFNELIDQRKRPTAETIMDYFGDNPDVKKTKEQVENISKSKKLTDEIDFLQDEIRNYRQMQWSLDKPIIRTSVDGLDADIVGAEYLYNQKLNEKKVKSMEDKIVNLVAEKNSINEKLADSLKNFKYEPSLYDMRRYEGVTVEVEKMLEGMGKEIHQLPPDELARLYKGAEWKYMNSIGVETGSDRKKLYDGIANEVKKRNAKKVPKPVEKKVIKNIDDLVSSSDSYAYFQSMQKDLTKTITPSEEVLKGLPPEMLAKKQKEIDAINSRYDKIISGIEESTLNLEQNILDMKEAYKNFDTKQIEDLATQAKKYEEILNNADAFESYVSSVPGGKDAMEESLKRYNSDAGKYILDDDVDISKESKEAVEFLRNKFRDMGQSEVDIGKLGKGQVKANDLDYLPHMLTDDGKKLFANKDFQKKMQGFGDDAGFGREFNQFAKSRKFKTIPDGHGGWISKPTIVELNDFFREMAGGKDIFSTDVHELYIARAMKHNDLMYDNKYMENMMTIFGDVYDGSGNIKEGYSVAINYGKLKETTSKVARGHQSLDISDAISQHMSDPEVRGRIARETERRIASNNLGFDAWKKVNNEVAVEYINKFMDTSLTDEVRKSMYEGRLGSFVQSTRTGGMLDDLAVPLGHLDDDQVLAMNNSVSALKSRYEKHIRKRFGSFMQDNPSSKGITIDDLDIDTMKEMLVNASKGADEIDADRISRILNRIDEYSKIEKPQIGQINSAIFERANQARKLQIQRDQSKFLTIYDKITHFIKVNQTAILPGFHARNLTSNKFQSALGVGIDALDPELTVDAYKAMMFAEGKEGYVDKVISFLNKDGEEVSMKMSELYRAAKEHGAIDEGFFAKDLGTSGGEGLLSKLGVKGKFDPTNMDEFIPYVKGTEIGSTIENHDRFIHFISRVKSGDNFFDAAESVNKFLFDYSQLTAFEQNVMKRIFPYYTWIRKNAPLQLEMMLERPDIYRNVSKVIGGIEGMVNEEDKIDKRYVNDFAKDWVQTPFFTTNEDGRKEPVLFNPDLPYNDINDIPNPFRPKDTMQNMVSQMNPMLKLPVEFALNKNMFFDNQIAKRYDKDYYKPSEKYLPKYLEHASNQLGVVPLAKGIANKTGADFGFHLLNNTSGIKMMSYDYDKYKAMQISRYNTKKQKTKSNPGIIDSINRRLGGK